VLKVSSAAEVLRLVVVLVSYILPNLLLPLPLPCLVGRVLSVDLGEAPGVLLRQVVELAALDPVRQVGAEYNLKVALIVVKYLVPYIVLL
jgi:hypothetical protein